MEDTYRDLSTDEESDSGGSDRSEGLCEDVSFGSDDDETLLVNVDVSGGPVQGWLHEPVGQDNSDSLPADDEGDILLVYHNNVKN